MNQKGILGNRYYLYLTAFFPGLYEMVVNMNMHSEGTGSINAYLADTIASVFPAVMTADVKGGSNRELYAAMDAAPLNGFEQKVSALPDGELKAHMETVAQQLTSYVPGNYLLTDDQAPVELLGMQVIDGMIQQERGYYRDIFRGKGITGLLDAAG